MARLKKSQFLADVMAEIEVLKKNATKEELENLNFGKFNPKSRLQCIYGQMTGTCESNRAKQLMDKACKRVMNINPKGFFATGVGRIANMTFTEVNNEGHINGAYEGQPWTKNRYKYLSALEGYIVMKGAKNKEILQYLKGEIDTLKL